MLDAAQRELARDESVQPVVRQVCSIHVAEEARHLGIVSAVHPPERLLPATYELATKIALGPPIAIRLARRALYRNADADLQSSLEFETFAQNICADTEDAREGIRAFVEKREPTFSGR